MPNIPIRILHLSDLMIGSHAFAGDAIALKGEIVTKENEAGTEP